jgi:hypothetical protein
MASEREPSVFFAAQLSIAFISGGGMRAFTSGSFPVAGLPLFLCLTAIDLAMIEVLP